MSKSDLSKMDFSDCCDLCPKKVGCIQYEALKFFIDNQSLWDEIDTEKNNPIVELLKMMSMANPLILINPAPIDAGVSIALMMGYYIRMKQESVEGYLKNH